MQLNRSISPTTPTTIQPNWRERMALPTMPWPRHLWSLGFVLLWLAVLLGLPALFSARLGIPEAISVQIASWLTFFAVFITPGWLIAEILTWHLELDWLERLALAFPLGVAVMAVPGMAALLLHITLAQLNILWIAASAVVVVAWLIHLILRRSVPAQSTGWTMDEVILAVLLLAAFIYLLPTLNAYKIDGDAYAVATFAADALAGLPLNAREPLFGTDLGLTSNFPATSNQRLSHRLIVGAESTWHRHRCVAGE